MEVRQLRYFVAAAEERSVTRAAARLFVAQPAVSRQIQLLERQMGVTLFERSSRGMTLTAAGTALLPRARRLVEQSAALLGSARARVERPDVRPGTRRFVVGLHDFGLGPLTSPLVRAFRAAHPDVAVQVRRVPYTELDSCLPAGQVDVLLTSAGATRDDDTVFEALFSDAMSAAMPFGSPLADAPVLGVEDVLDRRLVETGPVPEALTAPFLLIGHRNGERSPVVDAPPPAVYADLMLQVVYQDAFLAVAAMEATTPCPGVVYVPLHDAGRVATGVAVARAAEPRSLATAFRRLARTTAVDLIDLLPTVQLDVPAADRAPESSGFPWSPAGPVL